MPVYHVSYDLNSPGQNYAKVTAILKKFPHLHFEGSTWLVSTSKSATEILALLKPALDGNDRLFVSRVFSDRNGWLNPQQWEWVKARE